MKQKIHLEIGQPVVVAHGEVDNRVWGDTQFPAIYNTVNDKVLVSWERGDDSIEYNTIVHWAVSGDGGNSWGKAQAEDMIAYPEMPNGKRFVGFLKKGAHAVDYFDKYVPVYTSELCVKRYFAKDISETQDTAVYGIELDPVSGEETVFECKINWPYMPINVTTSGMVFPSTMSFSLSQKCGFLVSGEKIFFTLYCRGFNSDASSRKEALLKYMEKCCVYVFESCDCGRSWNYLSHIQPTEEVFRLNPDAEGFCEPMMERLPDGSVAILLRTGSNSPLFIAHSTDDCKSWTEPTVFDSNGVFPQILTLQNGITIASYGRPTLKIRATCDPCGAEWEEPIVIPLTVSDIPIEKEDPYEIRRDSCFYTGMVATSENTALMVYSDFHYPNPDGIQVKTILVRKITAIYAD